jgi:hypothetical protein
MGRRLDATIVPNGEPAMSKILDLRSGKAAPSSRPGPLDVVIARLAQEHDSHETGILPCYLCLHGVARRPLSLRKAA